MANLDRGLHNQMSETTGASRPLAMALDPFRMVITRRADQSADGQAERACCLTGCCAYGELPTRIWCGTCFGGFPYCTVDVDSLVLTGALTQNHTPPTPACYVHSRAGGLRYRSGHERGTKCVPCYRNSRDRGLTGVSGSAPGPTAPVSIHLSCWGRWTRVAARTAMTTERSASDRHRAPAYAHGRGWQTIRIGGPLGSSSHGGAGSLSTGLFQLRLAGARRCTLLHLGRHLAITMVLALGLALPCSASQQSGSRNAQPEGSSFPSGPVLGNQRAGRGSGGGTAPSYSVPPLPSGGATVVTTFRVSPRTVSYSSWSTTAGGGYSTGAPILVRSGGTSFTGGYYLDGGRPSTVGLDATGAGARVVGPSAGSPEGAEPSGLVLGILAPASAADAILDEQIGLHGITDARGWVAHGDEGQGDLLVKVAPSPGPGEGENGECFWTSGGGPSGVSFFSNLAGGGAGAAALAYTVLLYLHMHPGDRLDHGAWLAEGAAVTDTENIGRYMCAAPSIFSVSLTPALVTRPGCLRTPPQPGATCNASTGSGDWSPAGTYSLNLQGVVLFS